LSEKTEYYVLGYAKDKKHLPDCDDRTLMSLVWELADDLEGRIEDRHYATLCGVAGQLLRRLQATMPPPAYLDEKGEGVYTSAQLAAWLGESEEKVHDAALELAKRDPEGKYVRVHEPENTTPVH
jgi:hypothetical protein